MCLCVRVCECVCVCVCVRVCVCVTYMYLLHEDDDEFANIRGGELRPSGIQHVEDHLHNIPQTVTPRGIYPGKVRRGYLL